MIVMFQFFMYLTTYFIAVSQLTSLVNDLEEKHNTLQIRQAWVDGNTTLLKDLLNRSVGRL